MIGRKIRIGVKKKVKLEVKGDKVENKVLVSAPVFLNKMFADETLFPLPCLIAGFSCSPTSVLCFVQKF